MKNTPAITALAALMCGPIMADTAVRYQDSEAIIADLRDASVTCATMDDGQVNDEVFGIQMVRFGETCVIANGEMDAAVRAYLEAQELDWAGIGLWVKAAE